MTQKHTTGKDFKKKANILQWPNKNFDLNPIEI